MIRDISPSPLRKIFSPRALLVMGGLSLSSGFLFGCATRAERQARDARPMHGTDEQPGKHSRGARTRSAADDGARSGAISSRSAELGQVEFYVARAYEDSPALRASFERWQAGILRISRARRLPEPTLSFGYFISSVETRVGPQLGRISLQQTFPWPTKLSAGADAASARSKALSRQVDALALSIRRRVVDAYYRLWLVRRSRTIHEQHLVVLESLSESVLSRVATGASTLAEQQQIELSRVRLRDRIDGMKEREEALEAEMRAVVGDRSLSGVPTKTEPPPLSLPSETFAELRKATLAHPQLQSYEYEAQAHLATARSEKADRLPSFSLGADWILTGPARMAGVSDSGKDAVFVGAGIKIPLYQGSYGDAVKAAQAEADAAQSEQAAAEDRATLALSRTLSELRDAVRRARVHETALVPAAEAAYESVLGAYMSGRGTVAQILLAQRDLLELRDDWERARVDAAVAAAFLEEIVGRPVRMGEDDESMTEWKNGDGAKEKE